MSSYFIVQQRRYYDAYTQSQLYLTWHSPEQFCWVLEDPKAEGGVKVAAETCIPEAVYNVSESLSRRFQKPMLLLSNTADFAVEKNGLRFTGIRPHGGNTVADTNGCPLCAYQSDGNGKVWSRASDDIQALVSPLLALGHNVYWVVAS